MTDEVSGYDTPSVSYSRAKQSKMGLTGCTDAKATNYQFTPRNIPEERRPQLTGYIKITNFLVEMLIRGFS
jgi:hypothetical protein